MSLRVIQCHTYSKIMTGEDNHTLEFSDSTCMGWNKKHLEKASINTCLCIYSNTADGLWIAIYSSYIAVNPMVQASLAPRPVVSVMGMKIIPREGISQ